MSAPDQDLDALFKRLHLANARRVWRDLVQRAEREAWSYGDFLTLLVTEEIAHRQQTRLGRLTRRAHFPFLKTIDDFNFTYQSTLRLHMLGSAFAPDFVTEGRSLILGAKKLDAITNEDVQRLKHRLQTKSPKTVNNVLTVLNVLLKTAVEWDVVERLPCTIRLLPTPKTSAQFHDFEAYERLVQAAERLDRRTALLVLLGGEAGLRCGEMMALEWSDVDLEKRQLRIERSDWKGQVTSTKGGRVRYVPMTVRLATALRQQRHLRGRRVLMQATGEPVTQKIVQVSIRRAARAAHAKEGVHILRHTFCSHLAMRGAPARAIQELAGHQDLGTTQRYMHLSPAAIEGAIRLVDQPAPTRGFGDILETKRSETAKASG